MGDYSLYERDPVDEPTTGEMISEIEFILEHGPQSISLDRKILERWLRGIIFAAAMLDPDNLPPLKRNADQEKTG